VGSRFTLSMLTTPDPCICVLGGGLLQKHITALKEKREKAAEKARYAALAEKMHKKRVERLKRREKRNKALKER